MKVLGRCGDKYTKEYIVSVTRTEIEKVFDMFYAKPPMDEIKIGDEIDLTQGYDFRSDVRTVCKQMIDANEKFHRSHETLLRFAHLVVGIDFMVDEEKKEDGS